MTRGNEKIRIISQTILPYHRATMRHNRHTKAWPLAALALLLTSSTPLADASHSSWRRPSLLKRPIWRRRHSRTTATIDDDIVSPIHNAVFCVRGGGEGNGPCIGIDLGKFCFMLRWGAGREILTSRLQMGKSDSYPGMWFVPCRIVFILSEDVTSVPCHFMWAESV